MDDSPPATDKTTSFFHDHHEEILGLLDQAAALFWAKKYKVACYALSRALDLNKEMLVSEITRTDDGGYSPQERKFSNDHSLVHALHTTSSSSLSLATPPSCSCLELLSFVIARSATKNDEDITSLSPPLKNDEMEGSICSWQVNRHRNIYACSTLMLVQPCKELFKLFENIPTRDTHLTLSLIIIFNMALCQHFYTLNQIKEGFSISTRCHLLNRSYLLYYHAKTLLHELQLQSCWFLSLGILNNEAQLLLIMGEHQEASSLLQVILSYLCYLNILHREGDGEEIIPVAALDVFVQNTSYMILKEAIAAEAA